MKTKHFGKKQAAKHPKDSEGAQRIAAVASAALCIALLAFTSADAERYEDGAVAASIEYTEPEKPEETGFWEIFTDAVVQLFVYGG